MPTGASSCSSSPPRGSASQPCGAIPCGAALGIGSITCPWEGGVFWDMIQPAFMFMVGVAMPFALARRVELGATPHGNFRHVLVRSIRLIILSQILIWVSAGQIKPQLINVLFQIAFTYFLSFLIMRWRPRYQVIASVALLAGWTALLFAFPGPDGPFSPRDHVGLRVDRA